MVLETVAVAVWLMVPAYLPNNAAVVAGGGRPIDGGFTLRGRQLLGDGKTWRGTVVGILVGIALALALNAIGPSVERAIEVGVPAFVPVAVVTLPVGAMVGDLLASLLKRRLGVARGQSVPVLDQLDFVAGALALTAVTVPGWFGRTFTGPVLVVVVVITPVLHVGTNVAAYRLGLKSEPW